MVAKPGVCDNSAMRVRSGIFRFGTVFLWLTGVICGDPQMLPNNQPDFIRQGQRLIAENKPEEALYLYKTILNSTPGSVAAGDAAGSVLDLLGQGDDARVYFQKIIDAAADPEAKARAQRAMAISWAFSGNCQQTVEYESMVMAYFINARNFEKQGEIASEAARVCLDNGDPDTAFQWYLTAHGAALKAPEISDMRKIFWEYRWEEAQARVAARKGNQTEADKHVAAAKALLQRNRELAATQRLSLADLLGYVAFYRGDYESAAAELEKADPSDAAIQRLAAEACERLGRADDAKAHYATAAAATAHDSRTAYARPFARKKLETR